MKSTLNSDKKYPFIFHVTKETVYNQLANQSKSQKLNQNSDSIIPS